MELEELWTQFKVEAGESSWLYKQDVTHRAAAQERNWKRPLKVFAALFWSVLRKLSPARCLFLLLTMILAVLAIINFHFLFFTQEVEFILAFGGLLILLALVLSIHISMKRDIEIARDMQRWLVPCRAPEVPGIDIAFATRPAKTIGGDYYDAFLRTSDGPLLIAVADVAGKSVPAAMLMATFQASLRALASASGSLSDLVGGLNRQVYANSQSGRFTTAFLAELNPATGDLSYLCAGHNPPILKREDGTFERLRSDNIPLHRAQRKLSDRVHSPGSKRPAGDLHRRSDRSSERRPRRFRGEAPSARCWHRRRGARRADALEHYANAGGVRRFRVATRRHYLHGSPPDVSRAVGSLHILSHNTLMASSGWRRRHVEG
jgi:hypothetical protein